MPTLPPIRFETSRFQKSINALIAWCDVLLTTGGGVPATRNLTAGDGLTGGGDLSVDRTFAVGAPGTVTASSSNGVTADSHTHAASGFAVPGDLHAESHALLSTPHSDATAAAVVRGDLIYGKGTTPKWERLAIGATGTYLAGGTEPSYATLNQAAIGGIKTTDSPVFVTVKLSGLTDDYIPYHINDATGLANGPTKTNVDSAISLKHAAATAGTGIGVSGQQINIDLTANLTWTGAQVFQGTNTYRHLTPEATKTYDVGAYNNIWRSQYVSNIYATIFAKETIQLIGGAFIIPKDTGVLPAVASADVTIDFGKAMTPNDHLLIKSQDTGGAYKTEYIKVLTLVSGTTYNVTRDEAGAHVTDPAWPSGTPYAVLGTAGNGFINFDATTSPRMSIWAKGTNWNNDVEQIRIGDLNTNWGYAAPINGIAIGEYAASKANMTYDSTNGLRLRIHDVNYITLSNAGAATIAGTLAMGAAGKITIDTDKVVLDTNGISMSFGNSRTAIQSMKWMDGATERAYVNAYRDGSYNDAHFTLVAEAGFNSIMALQSNAPATYQGWAHIAAMSGVDWLGLSIIRDSNDAAWCKMVLQDGIGDIFTVKATGDITTTGNLTMAGRLAKEYDSTLYLANGESFTSTLVLGNFWMILVTVVILDGGAVPVGSGMWLVSKYTGTLVTAIAAIANIAITVNGSFKIVLTNNTGAGKYLGINMIRLS